MFSLLYRTTLYLRRTTVSRSLSTFTVPVLNCYHRRWVIDDRFFAPNTSKYTHHIAMFHTRSQYTRTNRTGVGTRRVFLDFTLNMMRYI